MKLYGFEPIIGEAEPSLRELTQATIVTTSEQLRQLAQFLVRTADAIDQHGTQFNHAHYRDFCKETGLIAPAGDVDLIVTVKEDRLA